MNDRDSFEDDLTGFRQYGIGVDSGLFPDCHTPEIGATIGIRAATAGRTAIVVIDDDRFVEIDDNGVLQLQILENRPYRLTLQDHHGHILARVELIPKVVLPRIDRLSIPERVTYADPNFRIDVAISDVQEVDANWRIGGEGNWHPMDFVGGAYFVPIPRRPAALQIGMRFRSKHAAFSREAEVVVTREVHVVHPEPKVEFNPSSRALLCTEPASCEIVAKWVSHVLIEWDSHRQAYSPRGDHQVIASMALSTAELGDRCMRVSVRDLGGQTHELLFDYTVNARPLVVTLTRNADGNVEFDIIGGVRAWLSVPSRYIVMEVTCSSGVITHDFLVPVGATLMVMDDNGMCHRKDFVLDRAPHLRKTSPLDSDRPSRRL